MSRTANFFDKVLCSISCNSLANQTKSKVNISSFPKLKDGINRTKSSGKYKKFRAIRRYHKSGRLRSEFQEVSTSAKCKLNEKSSPFYRSLYSYKRIHRIKSPEKRFRHLHIDDTEIMQFSRKINAFRACRNSKDKIAWPPLYKYKGDVAKKRKVSPLPFKGMYRKKIVKKPYSPEDLQPLYPTKLKPTPELPKLEKIEKEPEKPKETPEKKLEEVENLKSKIKIHKESYKAVDNIKRMQYKFEKLSKTNNILMGQYLKMSIDKELEDLKRTSPKLFTNFINENNLLSKIDCKNETRSNEIKQEKAIYPHKTEFENAKPQNEEEIVNFTVVEKLLEQNNTKKVAEQEKERLKSRFSHEKILEKAGKSNSVLLSSQNVSETKEKALKTKFSNEKFLQHPSGAFNNILFRTLTTDTKEKPLKLKTAAYEPLYRCKKDEGKAFKVKKLPEKYQSKAEPVSKMQKNVANLKKLIQEKMGREGKKASKPQVPVAMCALRKITFKTEIPKERKPRFSTTPRMTSPNVVDTKINEVSVKTCQKPKSDPVIKDVFQSEAPLEITKDCETCKDIRPPEKEERPKADEALKSKISACANEINIEVNLKKAKGAEKKVQNDCAPKVESCVKDVKVCATEKKECNVKEIEQKLIKEIRSEVRKACEKSIKELKTEFSKACSSIREQRAKSLKRKKPCECLSDTLEELYSASIKEVENISKCLEPPEEAPKKSKLDEIISRITDKIYKKETKKASKKEKPKSKKRRSKTPERHVFQNPNVIDCRDRSGKGNFKVEISADVPLKVERNGQFIHATISLPKTEKKKSDKDKKLIVPILQVAAAAVAKDKDQGEKSKCKNEKACIVCPKTELPNSEECPNEPMMEKHVIQICPKEDSAVKECEEQVSCKKAPEESEPQKESSDKPECSWPKETTEPSEIVPVQADFQPNVQDCQPCVQDSKPCEEKPSEPCEPCETEEKPRFEPLFSFRPHQSAKNDQSKVDLKAIRSTFARSGQKTWDPTEITIPEIQTSLLNAQDPILKCFLSPESEVITCLVDSRHKQKLCGEEEKPVRTKATIKRKRTEEPIFNHRCITVPKSAYRLKLPTETANYEKTWYTDMTKNTKRKDSSIQVHK